MLLVRMFQEYGRNSIADKRNKSWHNGTWISVNEVATFMLYHRDDGSIEFIVQGNISKKCHHDSLFGYIAFVNLSSRRIRDSRFPGLQFSFVLKCTNCKLGSMANEASQVSDWPVTTLLHRRVPYYACDKCETTMPVGLLAPICQS